MREEIFLIAAVGIVAWLISASASEFLSGDYRREFEEDKRNQIIWREELKDKGIEVDNENMR